VLKIYALINEVQFTLFRRWFKAINVEVLLEFNRKIFEHNGWQKSDNKGKNLRLLRPRFSKNE
jgi:hypothetical protein